ncbi:MAG: alpha-2-macroglobulin family protein, partial [Myxococcaceae bacterium]
MVRSLSLSLAVVCSLFLLADSPAGAAKPPGWAEIDRLVSEQKLEAAAKGAGERLAAAKAARDEPEWTRALIKVVQLRIGLHGYETAVRFLKAEPWPKGVLHRTALNLYYASALENYASAYSWEVNQRERVESKEAVDLKAWTAEQIHTEAQRALEETWRAREALGAEPVGRLSEYFEAGTYPKGIRDTLRDAVSYFRVASLVDSSTWRPEQSNELYRLDLPSLVKGDPAASARVMLEDPAVHPLVRAMAVLDDLEAWHGARKEPEAAFEARLTRLRTLHGSFTDEKARESIRKELQARLPAMLPFPWYSVGQATLAELTRDAGELVRAREAAEEGRAAYPDSIGGQRCLSLVKAIEAPDFQVASMSSDGPQKRSIEVTHKNLGELYFRSYPVDAEAWIARSRDYNLLPQGAEISGLIRTQKPEQAWTVALPKTPDFKPHRTFVTPPMTRPGLHVVVASARADFSPQANRLLAVNLVIGDLTLVTRTDASGGVEVSVVSGSSGKPVAGAQVALYRLDYNRAHEVEDRRTADAHGVASFTYDSGRQGGSLFLVARNGADLALDPQPFGLYRHGEPGPQSAALVFTDRSIYRPLQKVLWKVVAYRGSAKEARYSTLPATEVTVRLMDPNNQVVESRKVKTNAFGSAAGEFTIPTGRLLGAWRVTSAPNGAAVVRVEEYKRPTFEVAFKDAEAPMRLNKPATLVGEAKYYFGMPLSSGAVKWRVTRSPQYPWWWEWYGGVNVQPQVVATGVASLQEDGSFRFTFTPEADEKRAGGAEVTYRYEVAADVTDDGGETRSASRSVRLGLVAVEAAVSMPGGFLRAGLPAIATVARTDLDGVPRAGKGQWRLLALKAPSAAVLPADEPAAAPPPGLATGGGEKVTTPGDRLRPRWQPGYLPAATVRRWADGAEVGAGSLSHDPKGQATASLPALPPGAYRLRYETTDDFGAKYQTFHDFFVAAPSMALPLPALLLAERTKLSVGDTARFLVHSGLAAQPLVFDVYRGGKRVERRYLTAGKDPSVVEVPVSAADRGGFSVSLTAVRDFQLMSSQASVFVPWDDKELKLEFATFRDRLRPGAKESFKVTVKGPSGGKPEAAAAELLMYMYDQSLDAFAPHTPASVAGLYPNRTGVVYPRASLGQAWGQWLSSSDFVTIPPYPGLAAERLKFEDSYGIGGLGMRGTGRGGGGRYRMSMRAPGGFAQGMEERDEAPQPESPAPRESTSAELKSEVRRSPASGPPPPPEPGAQAKVEVRQNFSETAFWQPQLLAGADGSASVEFTVPDSVTSWSVWAHAVTRDLRGGSTSKQTKSVKDLMVRPYLPRFLREGDQASVKVVINNASSVPMKGNLRFEIQDPDSGASLLADFGSQAAGPQPFSAEPGKSATLTFPIVAPKRVGTVAFKVTAIAGDLSDGELRPLPVLPSRMHLAQSRFVTLRDKDKRTLTFADLARGGDPTLVNEQLVVTVDAQLFYTVLQALPYLVNYPYECTEQTLNRFVSTGIVASLYGQYPAVAKMAQQMSKRDSPLETFDAVDPN